MESALSFRLDSSRRTSNSWVFSLPQGSGDEYRQGHSEMWRVSRGSLAAPQMKLSTKFPISDSHSKYQIHVFVYYLCNLQSLLSMP